LRLARAGVVALLILFMAVTPLSALIAPGEFEVTFTTENALDREFTLRLADRTGLVRGLAVAAARPGIQDAVTNFGVDGRMLIVEIEGSSCDYVAHLTFQRALGGFQISARTEGFSCGIGTGSSHVVAIHLWAPIDASRVEFALADGDDDP
jgi:hypothetical protein